MPHAHAAGADAHLGGRGALLAAVPAGARAAASASGTRRCEWVAGRQPTRRDAPVRWLAVACPLWLDSGRSDRLLNSGLLSGWLARRLCESAATRGSGAAAASPPAAAACLARAAAA